MITLLHNLIMLVIFFGVVQSLCWIIKVKIRGNLILRFIRNLMFFLPYFLPFLYFEWPKFKFGLEIYWYIASIIIGLSFCLLEIKKFKVLFDKEYYFLMPPLRFSYLLISFNACIGASIFEEIFYRGIISSMNNESNLTFIIFGLTSSFLFVYSHYLGDQKRDKYSYIILAIFSLVQFALYALSGSIITCIIVHLIFNTPALIIDIRRYLFTRRELHEEF